MAEAVYVPYKTNLEVLVVPYLVGPPVHGLLDGVRGPQDGLFQGLSVNLGCQQDVCQKKKSTQKEEGEATMVQES